MIGIRWLATPWAFLQVLAYRTAPYPHGVRALALGVAAALPAGNAVLWLALRRARAPGRVRAVAMSGISFDVALASAFVWLFTFDQVSALWAILFILPLEGAVLFQLTGALSAWLVTALLYAGREMWGSRRYGYALQWESVSFRMGIGLLIALAAGLMARQLVEQREELAAAVEDLRRVDRLRTGLVATLAHDVRNPLAAIRASVQTLRANPDRHADRSRLLDIADRQAGRLERLAHQLLDVTQLEQGRIELRLQPIAVAPVVRHALSLTDGEQRVRVDIPHGLLVRGDPDRLEQIIVNLVANQLRYGEPPFTIAARRDGTVAVISVTDEGRGIASDKQRDLFEPFAVRSEGGSVGLGLSIVRALAEAQGGTIRYEANAPRGACFEIRLPLG